MFCVGVQSGPMHTVGGCQLSQIPLGGLGGAGSFMPIQRPLTIRQEFRLLIPQKVRQGLPGIPHRGVESRTGRDPEKAKLHDGTDSQTLQGVRLTPLRQPSSPISGRTRGSHVCHSDFAALA